MEGVVRHQLEEVDKENFKRELREALRILIAAGAEEVSTHRSDGQKIVCKGKGAKNLEEFLEKVTVPGGMGSKEEHCTPFVTAHQLGICRMDAQRLQSMKTMSWDADASVLPSAIGVNPMITIQSTP